MLSAGQGVDDEGELGAGEEHGLAHGLIAWGLHALGDVDGHDTLGHSGAQRPREQRLDVLLVLAAPAMPLSQAATSRRVRVSTGTAPRTGLMCRAAMRR